MGSLRALLLRRPSGLSCRHFVGILIFCHYTPLFHKMQALPSKKSRLFAKNGSFHKKTALFPILFVPFRKDSSEENAPAAAHPWRGPHRAASGVAPDPPPRSVPRVSGSSHAPPSHAERRVKRSRRRRRAATRTRSAPKPVFHKKIPFRSELSLH